MKKSTLNSKMKLFSIGTNAKTIKGDEDGVAYTAIMYLAPSTTSGYDVCPSASASCRQSCLGWFAGRSRFSNVQKARINKTKLYFENREEFIRLIKHDLDLFKSFCDEHQTQGYVRINGSSDIKVEELGVLEAYPDLQFYDYTKRLDHNFTTLPSNYHLTFSRDERTRPVDIKNMIDVVNVAVVFDEVPNEYEGIEVINGDETDLRPLDKVGVIVGLKAKGEAKKERDGFVIRTKG